MYFVGFISTCRCDLYVRSLQLLSGGAVSRNNRCISCRLMRIREFDTLEEKKTVTYPPRTWHVEIIIIIYNITNNTCDERIRTNDNEINTKLVDKTMPNTL